MKIDKNNQRIMNTKHLSEEWEKIRWRESEREILLVLGEDMKSLIALTN